MTCRASNLESNQSHAECQPLISAGHPFPKYVYVDVLDSFYIRGWEGKQHIADINSAARATGLKQSQVQVSPPNWVARLHADPLVEWYTETAGLIIVIPVVIAYHWSPRECVTVYCKPYRHLILYFRTGFVWKIWREEQLSRLRSTKLVFQAWTKKDYSMAWTPQDALLLHVYITQTHIPVIPLLFLSSLITAGWETKTLIQSLSNRNKNLLICSSKCSSVVTFLSPSAVLFAIGSDYNFSSEEE